MLGDFFCPGCGGDRNYRRQHGRRWLRLLGSPVLPLGPVLAGVQCTNCLGRYGLESLEQLTSGRLTALLRDAQYTIALALLAAGGTSSAAARAEAGELVRAAGFEDGGEAQLLAALAALLGVDAGEPLDLGATDGLLVELHAALEPLAPHLAQQGRERLLLQGARIALADGRYLPQERAALAAAGGCLRLSATVVDQLLEAATRTAH
ncbi:TerB family tellurite resistance protein [Kitasatospora sp. NBC_01287]|uniref:TerB family tellurite resistance protein n=1 Tax=Kitasatospora sp. NBC_01287 TaxID=2903573 RepID=UPI0022599665|nr:TerB family tellurite resistance protein [Kitasatospora sp. NBC_01287]MCX4749077.1 TerB family tellurite resistance protein [Kitasatospora sp. NBC_01287]